jgi:hypothetical protein
MIALLIWIICRFGLLVALDHGLIWNWIIRMIYIAIVGSTESETFSRPFDVCFFFVEGVRFP